MKINWSFIEPVRDQATRLRGDFTTQSEIVKLAEQQARIERLRAELAAEKEQGWKAHAANLSLEEDNDALREENARLRSILATKVRPPFDDDLAGEPYAAKDRQPEPGGLGRVGKVEGGGEDSGA
jgi:hypothetical protein